MTKYPERAGFTDLDTSKAAADQIEAKGRAETLRQRVLQWLEKGDFTADEIASLMGEDILSVRPRVTELFKQGEILDTGRRKENARSGKKAKILSLKRGQMDLI